MQNALRYFNLVLLLCPFSIAAQRGVQKCLKAQTGGTSTSANTTVDSSQEDVHAVNEEEDNQSNDNDQLIDNMINEEDNDLVVLDD